MSEKRRFEAYFDSLTDFYPTKHLLKASTLSDGEKDRISARHQRGEGRLFLGRICYFIGGLFGLIFLVVVAVSLYRWEFSIWLIIYAVIGGAFSGLAEHLEATQNTPTQAYQDELSRTALRKLKNWHEDQQKSLIILDILDTIIEREEAKIEDEIKSEHHASALHSAVELIVAATRTLQPETDNSVMLTTIDGELKSIVGDAERLNELKQQPDLMAELGMVQEIMQETGVTDRFITKRLAQIFQ